MTNKIKILFLAANPVDAGYRPRLDKEASEISQQIQLGTNRDSFKFITEWAVRPDTLRQILLRHKPDIVHFSGHGSKTQGIMLEDEAGEMTPVHKRTLAELFMVLKDNIRVVVLNACYTKWQIEAFAQTIDYTVGMKKAIGDKAAIVFAAAFYQNLAFACSVRKAFELAKIELNLQRIPESRTPVLLVREDVDASAPLLLQPIATVGGHHEHSSPQNDRQPKHGVTMNFHGEVVQAIGEAGSGVYIGKGDINKG